LMPAGHLMAEAQVPAPVPNQPMTLRSDIQEANAKTGVVTARGNVQINYPSRQIQATAAQAQYFSKERRIVLSGNVYVLQQGNSLRGETVTYLIDEGRFVALPQAPRQVESIYLVQDATTPTLPAANPAIAPNPTAPFGTQPEFSTPINTTPGTFSPGVMPGTVNAPITPDRLAPPLPSAPTQNTPIRSNRF
ncbi:MAG TPA: LptA/OstA family protein, partial [Microcoleaceae cyanobacterium]